MKKFFGLLLILYFPCLFASVTVQGHVFTQMACPAYVSKNTKSNPDNLVIPAEKMYVVKEINKSAEPDWYRIWVPDSHEYPLRWISASCGKADFQAPSQESCDHTPNKADNYILALSWQPGFCQTYGYDMGKPECLNLHTSSFEAHHFSLHGLWPNQNNCGQHYNFCNATAETQFCNYAPVTLKDNVATRLKKYMPSFVFGTCLERHEWNKHGTCQSLSSNRYFSLALDLIEQANASPFAKYVDAHKGQQVARASLYASLIASFGEKAKNKVYLGCKNAVLVDVYIQLPKEISTQSTLSELISEAPETSQYEGCPETVYISDFNSEWTP